MLININVYRSVAETFARESITAQNSGLNFKNASALLKMNGMGNIKLDEKIVQDAKRRLNPGGDQEKYMMTPIEDGEDVGSMFDF